jgi:succinyl-diaminopimelate desuccinylase
MSNTSEPKLSEAVELCLDLVRCASVTPEDGGALPLLERVLSEAGFEVERAAFSEDGTPTIQNLLARIGNPDGPCLVFAGHTDVVPTGPVDRWTHPPFVPVIQDGRLYGRGAEDMKGGVAASVAAALSYLRTNGAPKKGSIAFLITGDEEGPAINGTVKLLAHAKAKGYRLDHCVLGEPTNVDALGDMMKIGRRGSLSFRLIVDGKQGHVAYPERADNAVHGLTRLMTALLATPLDAGTAHFAPSNLEFTTVDVGNPATNVVPGEAKAAFNIRFNDTYTSRTLDAEIRKRLEAAAAGRIRYRLETMPTNAEAFLTKPGPFVDMMRECVRDVTGQEPVLSTTGGTSDARFIKDYCPVVEFGLVGRTMHQIDENIAVADLDRLTAVYARLLERYFA